MEQHHLQTQSVNRAQIKSLKLISISVTLLILSALNYRKNPQSGLSDVSKHFQKTIQRSQNPSGLIKPEDSVSYKKFLLETYMEMIGILPRYNTTKCQLQSMCRYLTRYTPQYVSYSLK